MSPAEGSSERAVAAQRRAAAAHQRADRERASAERHERLAAGDGGEFHRQLASMHRRMADRHTSSARLQESFAQRMTGWTTGNGAPPRFMSGVAEACGTGSAALTLVDSDHRQLAVAASDQPSKAAQELEYVIGEGPTTEAARVGRQVAVRRPVITKRWPLYGPELAALDISEVVAVPLASPGVCLGTLAVFDPRPGLGNTSMLADLAETLMRTVLLGPDADPDLYGGVDHRDVVQQAAGIVSARSGRPVGDALALIRARAFTLDEPITAVARQIVSGTLMLGRDLK